MGVFQAGRRLSTAHFVPAGGGSKSADFRKFDSSALNNVFWTDRWPLRSKVGAPIPVLVHLEVRSEMRRPLDCRFSGFRPLGGESRNGIFYRIVRAQGVHETGGIVGRLRNTRSAVRPCDEGCTPDNRNPSSPHQLGFEI